MKCIILTLYPPSQRLFFLTVYQWQRYTRDTSRHSFNSCILLMILKSFNFGDLETFSVIAFSQVKDFCICFSPLSREVDK